MAFEQSYRCGVKEVEQLPFFPFRET